jgi:hypothetical protein
VTSFGFPVGTALLWRKLPPESSPLSLVKSVLQRLCSPPPPRPPALFKLPQLPIRLLEQPAPRLPRRYQVQTLHL